MVFAINGHICDLFSADALGKVNISAVLLDLLRTLPAFTESSHWDQVPRNQLPGKERQFWGCALKKEVPSFF